MEGAEKKIFEKVSETLAASPQSGRFLIQGANFSFDLPET